MLEGIGIVTGLGLLSFAWRISHKLGMIEKGLNGLVKSVDDHEGRLRKVEHDG